MSTINGSITGVSLLASNSNGAGALRKAFLVAADFAAYTSSDSATITGILTAIAAHERNGKSLTLRMVGLAQAGQDAAGTAVYFAAASNAAATLSNTTTTGDAAGNLADAAGSELSSTSGVSVGVQVVAIVDEA